VFVWVLVLLMALLLIPGCGKKPEAEVQRGKRHDRHQKQPGVFLKSINQFAPLDGPGNSDTLLTSSLLNRITSWKVHQDLLVHQDSLLVEGEFFY
jgi:hypothetical protein